MKICRYVYVIKTKESITKKTGSLLEPHYQMLKNQAGTNLLITGQFRSLLHLQEHGTQIDRLPVSAHSHPRKLKRTFGQIFLCCPQGAAH